MTQINNNKLLNNKYMCIINNHHFQETQKTKSVDKYQNYTLHVKDKTNVIWLMC